MSVNGEPILANEVADDLSGSQHAGELGRGSGSGPHIALISPYSGNNFGDAAILDSLIASLRSRLPGAQFSGITFNCDHFLAHHGARAFPLCGVDRSFHCMSRKRAAESHDTPNRTRSLIARIKTSFTSLPLIGPAIRWCLNRVRNLLAELRHAVRGYRFLRSHDCVIVAGGGQLDDEWGGSWGHPFALFKWAFLARISGIPFAIASVGACKISSRLSRFFLRMALRRASYRSYRDPNSHQIAKSLLGGSNHDTVVPDLAFDLPESARAADSPIQYRARGPKVVAVSAMVYARPGTWPRPDPAVYNRYLRELGQAISSLLRRGYLIRLIRSTSSDRIALDELIEGLDEESKQQIGSSLELSPVDSWTDLVAALSEADFAIASRLHSVILSFAASKPAIALSFDLKVDWAMSDLDQSAYRLDIHTFDAAGVLQAVDLLEANLQPSIRQIESFKSTARFSLAAQADALVALTRAYANHIAGLQP